MTHKENTRKYLALLGLIVLFTLTILCGLLLFSGPFGFFSILAPIVGLSGGVLALVVIRAYRKQGYPWKSAILAIVVGCFGVALVILSLLVLGLAWADNNPAVYTYQVTITGLENYTGGPVTDILLPLPVREGKLIFPVGDLEGQRFGIWKTLLAETRYGKMLVFQTTERNLSDVSASFGSPKDDYFLVDDITEEAFSPVVRDSAAGYTRWAFGTENVQTFTTLVRLDDGIKPEDADAGPIVIRLRITAGGGRLHGVTGEKYQVEVYEAVPPGITGMIPVKAQVARFGDTGIEPVVAPGH
jgi:hypothetical protein